MRAGILNVKLDIKFEGLATRTPDCICSAS
jgi:hypothetical protein